MCDTLIQQSQVPRLDITDFSKTTESFMFGDPYVYPYEDGVKLFSEEAQFVIEKVLSFMGRILTEYTSTLYVY